MNLPMTPVEFIQHEGHPKTVVWKLEFGDLDALKKIDYMPVRLIDRTAFARPILSKSRRVHAGDKQPQKLIGMVEVYPPAVLIKKFLIPPEIATHFERIESNLPAIPHTMGWGWKPVADKTDVYRWAHDDSLSEPVEERTWLFDAWGKLHFDWVTE